LLNMLSTNENIFTKHVVVIGIVLNNWVVVGMAPHVIFTMIKAYTHKHF